MPWRKAPRAPMDFTSLDDHNVAAGAESPTPSTSALP